MRTLRCLSAAALAVVSCGDDAAQSSDSAASTTDVSTSSTGSTGTTEPDPTTGGLPPLLCEPGEVRCADDATVEVCEATGLSTEKTACGKRQTCFDGACIGPCEVAAEDATSLGCEFLALRVQSNNGPDDNDALIVGNTDPKETAELQLYFTPDNAIGEEAIGGPVLLAPGASHIFDIRNSRMSLASEARTGGVYRVKSDIPVAAYLHSTLVNTASNDASLLLPVTSLRRDYVVASYPAFVDANQPDDVHGRPSYFMAIALADGTTITWKPKAATYGNGANIDAVAPGETGSITINRFDVLQIGASSTVSFNYKEHDVSGTVVEADHPIWVLGGTDCAFVPYGAGYCNHLQEQMLPLEYWGKTYVGPPSPARGDEMHYWRIYAGEDDTWVAVTSNSAEWKPLPIKLERRGDYKELPAPHGVSLIFQGLKPIMPVQYLAGYKSAGSLGDPAMYQMIPVEQWLNRYAFVTGVNYQYQYAQVTRRKGGAEVTIDGVPVTDWYFVSAEGPGMQYEIADVLLPQIDMEKPQAYFAASEDPFSVVVIGYNNVPDSSAYAYPGGMRLKPINQP